MTGSDTADHLLFLDHENKRLTQSDRDRWCGVVPSGDHSPAMARCEGLIRAVAMSAASQPSKNPFVVSPQDAIFDRGGLRRDNDEVRDFQPNSP
ncbi:MAG: hypothetical protein QOH28_3468, partial [Actinomycetota bacterium]|nr:hypothetical protein [Actinomycetota bacterium]